MLFRSAVGSVTARNLVTGSQYSFTETNTSATATQYRLKMVDNDGKFRYSEIRNIKGIGAPIDFTILPSTESRTLRLLVTDISQPVTIALFDGLGRMIRTVSNNPTGSIDINNLQKGLMFIRMTIPATGEQVTKKTIIY